MKSRRKDGVGRGGILNSTNVLIAAVAILFASQPSPGVYASSEARVATVIVKSEATVRRDRFTLGDIAEVRATSPELGTRLRELALGYSPQIGAVREISRERLQLAISGAGVAAELVDLNAPPVVKVRRQSQKVDPKLVREVVEASLRSTFKSMGATATLSSLQLPQEIEVASGDLQIRALATGSANLLVQFQVSLEFAVDGVVTKRLNVNAQVEAFEDILVAANDLPKAQRLIAADARIERVKLEQNPKLYIRDKDRLRGVSLISPLKAGQSILSNNLVSELVMKPGDSVRIIGESESLKLTVMGEARASGRIGDRILVKNLQSGLMFQATVVDEGTVRVRF